MTATQRIKREILLQAIQESDLAHLGPAESITAETVDSRYDLLVELDAHSDYENELRASGWAETGLPCPSSRHYESKAVARRLSDGSWVGWTYYFGGGKHGEQEAIDWMEDAYDLEVTEAKKMVVVRQFKRADGPCSTRTIIQSKTIK